ncbi:MAG: hypothetical protein V2G42_00775 [bacterium JZ-2024 1]
MEIQSQFPNIGKTTADFFDEVIIPRLGAHRRDVLVSPRQSIDIGIIQMGNGQVMAITADPFHFLIQYGWEKAAWIAWHILASDVVNFGFPPSHFIIDLNLPIQMTEQGFAIVWFVVDRECQKEGVAIVAGHTG